MEKFVTTTDGQVRLLERGPEDSEQPANLSPVIAQAPQTLAEAAGSTPPAKPKPLSSAEKLVALQRKWRLAYPDDGLPEDMPSLLKVVPSGLSRRELQQFLRGGLEDAKITFLKTYNTSWTKAKLAEATRKAGVPNALQVFPRQTRREIEQGIRFLTDE